MADVTVYEFKKNQREVVRVAIREFKGHRLVDFRVFVPGAEKGELLPTHKGLSLPLKLAPELQHSLDAVMSVLEGETAER